MVLGYGDEVLYDPEELVPVLEQEVHGEEGEEEVYEELGQAFDEALHALTGVTGNRADYLGENTPQIERGYVHEPAEEFLKERVYEKGRLVRLRGHLLEVAFGPVVNVQELPGQHGADYGKRHYEEHGYAQAGDERGQGRPPGNFP